MWINVQAELPQKEGWYIVCIKDFGIPQAVGLAYYEPSRGGGGGVSAVTGIVQ